MTYGLSTRAITSPIASGQRGRFAVPRQFLPLSQFFLQQPGGKEGDGKALYGLSKASKKKGLQGTSEPKTAPETPKERQEQPKTAKSKEETTGIGRFLSILDEKRLSDIVPKGRWVRITPATMGDKELNQELFDLIQKAYKPLGGHLKIKTPSDIAKEASFIMAVDVDKDPFADAVLLGKAKSGKVKLTAMGQDTTSAAKKAALAQWAKQVKTGNAFAEVSGPIAHILLTRFGASSIRGEKEVRKMLGKPITWVGKHPSGKYPDHPNWYSRVIGGEEHLKIMVGKSTKRTEGITTTANVPTVPVPIGAGDGRRFLDRPDDDDEDKKKKRMSRKMSVLLKRLF